MEFAIGLVQKIPAGWPRLAVLGLIVLAYFFCPDIAKKIKGGQKEKETLERITRLLQVKKLMFEVEALQKEKNLAGFEFPRETHVLADLKQPEEVRDKSTEKISYVMRLKYSLLGGAIFFLLTALVFALSKLQETTAAGTLIFILRDLSFAAACAASFAYSFGNSAHQSRLWLDDGPVGASSIARKKRSRQRRRM